MSRILKVTSNSPKYLEYFNQQYPHIKDLSFMEHRRTLEWDAYAENGFWTLNMAKFPGFQFQEHYLDNRGLQEKWAMEHGVRWKKNWISGILEEQIAEFEPSLIYEDEVFLFTPEYRKKLKLKFPFIKHFIGWDGYIKSDISRFLGCDLMFTCIPGIKEKYRIKGMNCYLLPFGFEPSILDRLNPGKPRMDISFVGNIIPNIHSQRLRILFLLSRSFEIHYWISNFSNHISHLKRRANYYLQSNLTDWAKIQYLERINQGNAYGLKMYSIFRDSKITLNIHGDQVSDAGNLRLIETTGTGTCLVTDHKHNLSQYFEEGKEVITFHSPEEVVARITDLLTNDSMRKEIAGSGQRKVFKEFSFSDRVNRFLTVIGQTLL